MSDSKQPATPSGAGADPGDGRATVLRRIAEMAMTAQSDPHASAEQYRRALIDVCNLALRAQTEARDGRAARLQAAIAHMHDLWVQEGLARAHYYVNEPDRRRLCAECDLETHRASCSVGQFESDLALALTLGGQPEEQ